MLKSVTKALLKQSEDSNNKHKEEGDAMTQPQSISVTSKGSLKRRTGAKTGSITQEQASSCPLLKQPECIATAGAVAGKKYGVSERSTTDRIIVQHKLDEEMFLENAKQYNSILNT